MVVVCSLMQHWPDHVTVHAGLQDNLVITSLSLFGLFVPSSVLHSRKFPHVSPSKSSFDIVLWQFLSSLFPLLLLLLLFDLFLSLIHFLTLFSITHPNLDKLITNPAPHETLLVIRWLAKHSFPCFSFQGRQSSLGDHTGIGHWCWTDHRFPFR